MVVGVTGGTSRFPNYASGSFAGMTIGWASYLQAATTAPIEVLAVIQYLSTASWADCFYRSTGTLSGGGIIAAVILMALFVVLNLCGIRSLTRANSAITSWQGCRTLAARGLSNQEIADKLVLSDRTVETYVYRAMQKRSQQPPRALTRR